MMTTYKLWWCLVWQRWFAEDCSCLAREQGRPGCGWVEHTVVSDDGE